ncbi:hypothetical protein WB350_24930, partial [Escherichia coli]|uniref:hypothetical protein n=1 Tax=Escherichia coli TaxID=562 RepID=UPI002148B158
MKNPGTRSAPRAGFSISKSTGRDFGDSESRALAQHASTYPLDGNGIGIASFWKSPRNRREAVQVSLRQYEGHAYADFRVYAMDSAGRLVPT